MDFFESKFDDVSEFGGLLRFVERHWCRVVKGGV
jgi:hypothetical protein